MRIVDAFTATSVIAIVINAGMFRHFLRQRSQQQADQKGHPLAAAENQRYARIALGFVLVWAMILLEDALMLSTGVGLLSGLRVFGYLLAAIPLVSVLIGVFAMRGFR